MEADKVLLCCNLSFETSCGKTKKSLWIRLYMIELRIVTLNGTRKKGEMEETKCCNFCSHKLIT
jgi:hypothetical protein